MTQRYLRIGIGLTVISFSLSGLMVVVMFLPLIGVVQNLTSAGKYAGVHAVPVLGHPAAAVAAAVLALASVVLTIRGVVGDRSRRVLWILLALVSLFSLLQSGAVAFMAPRFLALFADLRGS